MKYREESRYFAQVARNLEPMLETELRELGVKDTRLAYRGVAFEADVTTMMRVVYESRIASRVLAPLDTFACHNTDYLYRRAKGIAWEEIMTPDCTFAVFSNVSDSAIKHSKFAALRVKDAIADRLTKVWGKRPDVDKDYPLVPIHVYIHRNHCEIHFDVGGGPLHKRGYRRESVSAPMQETMAAAILRHTGWNGSEPLTDLCVGSGTILAEAMMLYCNLPAGYLRYHDSMAFLPEYSESTWMKMVEHAEEDMRELPEDLLFGIDINPRAVDFARRNLNELPGGRNVRIWSEDLREFEGASGTIIANPPYGIRMESDAHVENLMREMGDMLKHKCVGCNAYVYVGDKELVKKIGLRAKWKKQMFNGALDGRLVYLPMY